MPDTAYSLKRDARRIELSTVDGVRLHGLFWPARSFGPGQSETGDPMGLRQRAPGAPGSLEPLAYLVAHGFTGSSAHAGVRAICERLAGRGATVLSLDFRGHGRSGGSTSIGIDEELDLAAGLDFLRSRGCRRICAAGWSMGGSVVIRHAARYGGVEAVVSVSSPGLWYERGTPSMRRLHLAVETRLGRRVARHLLHTRIGLTGWDELPESPVELAARIAPIPFLIVHGDRDSYFPVRHAEALAAAAPGSQLWIEAGMDHAENSTSPELVDRIDAWVRRVTVGASG